MEITSSKDDEGTSQDEFGEDSGTSGWGQLPYIVLALIFSYLPDNDKFNASLVNRPWSEGFSWSGNWRFREMIFYGSCEDIVDREKAFVERFGAQLRILRLRCWSPARGPALLSFLDGISSVLQVLAEHGSLHEIHVADVEGLGYENEDLITVNDLLFENERKSRGKMMMGLILENLMRGQRELRLLDLQGVDCPWEIGLPILTAAASSPSASTTLHTLLLAGTFRLPSRTVTSSPEFLRAMSSFRNLTNLRMDYRCLSDALLDALGRNLGEHFLKLVVLCSEDDGPDLPTLKDEVWKSLASNCPDLLVEMTIEGSSWHAGWYNSILKSGIPLSSLTLEGNMLRLQVELWEPTPTLELLVRQYRSTLEHLNLGIGRRQEAVSAERVTADTVGRALRLKKLKTLHLSGQIDEESIKALYALLDKPQGAVHLEKVTLTAWCSSEEEVDRLLKAYRMAKQNRTSNKTEVYLIPML